MKHIPLFLVALLVCIVHLNTALYAQDTQENSEFKLAVGLYNDGLYELAEDQFTVFIDRFPNTSLGIEARFYLGLIQLKLKNYPDARSTFQEFALRYSDNPKAPDAWWHAGECFEAMRNYAEAASAYSRIKTFYPKNSKAPDALVAASRNFLKADDIHNAKLSLNAIVIEYSQSSAVREANFTLGEIYISEGDYWKALNEFQRLAGAPDAPADLKARAMVGAGRVHDFMGERVAAEQAFQQVIATYPKSVAAQEAYVLLGDVQRQLGDCSSAAGHYERIMKDAAADSEIRQRAFKGAAECAAASNDYSRAAGIYADLFKSFDGVSIAPEMYMHAGQVSRKAGNYTQAISYLELLYRDTVQRIDKPFVLAELARTAVEGRNYNDAAQRYREYVSRFPGNSGAPYALFELASLYEKQFQNTSQAARLYMQVVEQYGTSSIADEAQYRLAQTRETAGDYEGAGEAYRQLLSQFPASEYYSEAEARFGIIMRSHAGNTEAALKQVAEILSSMNRTPASGDVDFLLGTLYLEHLKMYPEAVSYYTEALRKGLPQDKQERAEFGKAIATVRQYESGQAGKQEAIAGLQSYLSMYPSGTKKQDAAYALYQVQSADASPSERLRACEEYLASGASGHGTEVRIMRGRALAESGRYDEAKEEFSTVLSASASEEAVDAFYWRGAVNAQRSDLPSAKKDFDEYIRKTASGRYTVHALMELGKLSARTGDPAQAAEMYETVTRRYRYADLRFEAELALLEALPEAGRNDRAAYVAREYWSTASANPFIDQKRLSEYLYQYAVVLAKVRDVAGAKRTLQEYVSRFPTGSHISDAYFALGQIYKDEGKTSLAAQYLQKAGAGGGNAEAGRAAADLLLRNGNYSAAIREYRKLAASEETPMGKTYAASRIVVALFRADSVSAAMREAEQFRATYPDAETVFDEFAIEQGKLNYRKRQYDAAENFFEEAEDSDSKEVAALANYWIGKTYEGRNKTGDAKEKYTDVIGDYPGTEGAMESELALGNMALRAEQYADAAVHFKRIVDAPDVPEAQMKQALNGLIISSESMKYYDAAAEMTKRFIAAYPYDPTVFRKKVNLGQYYYYLGFFDQSISMYQNLLAESTPDDQAEIRYYIGECYYYKGDYTQAALEFLKVPYLVVRKTEPDWRASSYYMAGQAYEKQSKFNLSLEMYNKILTLKDVDARFVGQARQEIDRVQKLID